MPKQLVAFEPDAINRDGETLLVRYREPTVQGCSVYLQALEANGVK